MAGAGCASLPRLAAALLLVQAHAAGFREIILVGCGMGARVAAHLLSGTPGDAAPFDVILSGERSLENASARRAPEAVILT